MDAQQAQEIVSKTYDVEHLMQQVRELTIHEPADATADTKTIREDLEAAKSLIDYMVWRMYSPRD